jgi:hypothetical protein
MLRASSPSSEKSSSARDIAWESTGSSANTLEDHAVQLHQAVDLLARHAARVQQVPECLQKALPALGVGVEDVESPNTWYWRALTFHGGHFLDQGPRGLIRWNASSAAC